MKNEFSVKSLGKCTINSPLKLSNVIGDGIFNYVSDDEKVIFDVSLSNFKKCLKTKKEPLAFEKAGPREKIFFEPVKTKAAIVTCGGLCPGLNNVIRSLVMELYYRYGVKNIIGIKYGYEGFISKYNHPIIELTPKIVEQIHLFGGTILGSSRGKQDVSEIVDTLYNLNINILFCIGGDGTLRGANAIAEEIEKRKLKIAVAGIPKTIDNDINFIEKSFGFETAFSIANEIIRDAHNEAIGAYNGISLIKLMGRDSGWIAANAALSMQEVNFVLIPELEFDLEGEKGFLKCLEKRILARNHAVILVSEGAGQFLFNDKKVEYDASGNVKYQDIGLFLKEQISNYFKKLNIPISLKYIDPSYIIRSAPANANDSKFCSQLAQNAVHGAMAGKTGFVVGICNHKFTYLPIPLAVKERKKISLESELWWQVLEATGQPMSMKN
ncbi:MAG TPA: ATP-dependent 6-phosphofructokinase [bacterium]|nr:ATP-dependent 6-phosphofructokinase [bacterium]HOL48651.1 ATP-dependent 6-phosphofructokinase [bacterium]HPQ19772.1 ATP-dependent 6-phosphofructokinase [bacterium]